MMLVKPPLRTGQMGFLFFPPIRVQGISVAGEGTAVMIPEYDVCFDIGRCHRPMLSAKYIALTHGHMDHVAGLPYYFSQRWFQGMGCGTCVCDYRIEPAVRQMMAGWVNLEQQKTKHEIIGLAEDYPFQIKNNISLNMFHLDHTVDSVGYSIVERRTKLQTEFTGLPQTRLVELKKQGIEISRELFVPVVTYLGDTIAGSHLMRNDVLNARVLITECTFFEDEHRKRAKLGKHIHVDDLVDLLPQLKCDALVITHVSRRTPLQEARKILVNRVGEEDAKRIHFLMDHRTNRKRYERQLEEAEAAEELQRDT